MCFLHVLHQCNGKPYCEPSLTLPVYEIYRPHMEGSMYGRSDYFSNQFSAVRSNSDLPRSAAKDISFLGVFIIFVGRQSSSSCILLLLLIPFCRSRTCLIAAALTLYFLTPCRCVFLTFYLDSRIKAAKISEKKNFKE